MRLIVLLMLLVGAAASGASCGGGNKPRPTATPIPHADATISSVSGGVLELPDGTRLVVPPAGLDHDALLALDQQPNSPRPPDWGADLGAAVNVDLQNRTLTMPATLELPFDATRLPADSTESAAFAAYFDDTTGTWVPAGGVVDTQRHVVIVELTHASWWAPWSWNWDAWIAVLSKTLELKLKSFNDAVQLLTAGCTETTDHATVDNSAGNNVVKGCIDQDDPSQPAVRVLNLKSFYVGVSFSGGGASSLQPQMLTGGDIARFKLNTSDGPPLRVSADFTQDAMDWFLVHMVLQMLPAGDLVPDDGIGVIAHAIAGDAHIASAIEDLANHDGAAAAEEITAMFKEDAFIQTFGGAAVQYGAEHNLSILKSWTVAGVKKVLIAVSATNVIIESIDFIANYFFNNHSAVSFNWVRYCPVNDQGFCAFVRAIDSALRERNLNKFVGYVSLETYTCNGVRDSDVFFPCAGKPIGTAVQCVNTGGLNRGGTCAAVEEYLQQVVTRMGTVYAVIYPTWPVAPPTLTGPAIIITAPSAQGDKFDALSLEQRNGAWSVKETVSAGLSDQPGHGQPYVLSGGIPRDILTLWQP